MKVSPVSPSARKYGANTYKKYGLPHPNTKWTSEIVAEWDRILRNGGTRKQIMERWQVWESTLCEKLAKFRGRE